MPSLPTSYTTPKTLIDMTRLYSKTQNRSIQKKASTKLRLQSLEAGEDWRRLYSTQMNSRTPTSSIDEP